MENTINITTAGIKTVSEDSDFKRIHYALQEAILANKILVDRVGDYSNQLKQLPPINQDSAPETEVPTTIVEQMWAYIYDLRSINDRLNYYTNHLQSVISK